MFFSNPDFTTRQSLDSAGGGASDRLFTSCISPKSTQPKSPLARFKGWFACSSTSKVHGD